MTDLLFLVTMIIIFSFWKTAAKLTKEPFPVKGYFESFFFCCKYFGD